MIDGILSMFGGGQEQPDNGMPALAPNTPQPGIFQQIQQGAQNNPGLLLAAAAGVGKGTTMGNLFSGIQDHYQLQDQLKYRKQERDDALQLKREQLEEQKRINTGKLQGYAAKAAQSGMPKKIGGAGGRVTLAWPDGEITSHLDTEVQEIYQTAEAAKDARVAMMAGTKAQADLQTPGAVKTDAEIDSRISDLDKSFNQYSELKDLMDATGGISLASRALPNGLSETLNRVLGTQDGKLQAKVAAFNMSQFVQQVSSFPGALSDKEGAAINKSLPKIDDDISIWQEFFKNYGPTLQRAYEKAKSQKEARQEYKATVNGMPSAMNGGAPRPAVKAPLQKYPPGFNPPNNGRSPVEDQRAILEQEYAAEQAKPGGGVPANLQSLRNELTNLGFPPKAMAPKAASGGIQQFQTPADVRAAIAAGSLKSGDYFLDPKGVKRKVN